MYKINKLKYIYGLQLKSVKLCNIEFTPDIKFNVTAAHIILWENDSKCNVALRIFQCFPLLADGRKNGV